MDVYEKTFDRVVALAIVQQQELAVACGAIAARAREDMREAWREAAEATANARADACFVEFVDDLKNVRESK